MDVAELTSIGSRIVELSSKLEGLRAKRTEAQAGIDEVETELKPLVLRHAQIIASVVGPLVPPAAPPDAPKAPGVDPPAIEVRQKVLRFLSQAEDSISAMEVAERLHLDPVVVRQIMQSAMQR
jgi:hypothetical protein